ncbi:MAG TPA: hypothetical protein VGA85_05250 [Dehalococcoidales bacterium]
MAEELGKIERPSLETFRGGRKLYIVPLLFAGTDAPEEFKEKCELYWQQVNEQISIQESKVGRVTRIFHESIAFGGEEGLKVMEKWNQLSYLIVKDKVENGAVLETTELADLSDECMDWERCLLLGFFSRKVAEIVAEHYRASAKERYEHISRRISEALQAGEVGILFIREGHGIQFPADVDVFSVAPPALDEIHRWLRDRSRGADTEEPSEPEQSPT